MSASESNSRGSTSPGLQMLGIAAVAMALGVAYNSASPLGVRAAHKSESAKPNPVADNSTMVSSLRAPAPLPKTGHVNQTVSMTLEMAGAPAAGSLPANTANPASAPAANAAANPANTMQFPEMTWTQVKTLLAANKVVLVDARLKANYDVSHIPGAISFPANSTALEVQLFAARYPKDTPFVIYCGSEQCHMSHQLAEVFFKICGYTNVSAMPGGFAEYLAAEPAGGARTP